jgi:bifunctional DNA-binding transcriptional regulator/antitoxin component of YhaV-PrlF toxin-antitoxin module
MQSVIVNESGQMTIPPMILEKLGIEKGGEVYLIESNGRVMIQNNKLDSLNLIQEKFKGKAKQAGWSTVNDAMEYVHEIRKEILMEKIK